MRILLVDDDPGFRALLRTTFEVVDVEVREAENAAEAEADIAAARPDALVLDVRLPGPDGLALCRKLKSDPKTRDIAVILLTGAEEGTAATAEAVKADAFLRKPFRPLELVSTVERLVGSFGGPPVEEAPKTGADEQLLLYAQDLRTLLEIERGQRVLLEKAYQETVMALASALESKDTGTRAHSQRVQRYAIELARAVAPDLVDDPSTEYGFLLHDVGKIGIPDKILQKPYPLTDAEQRLMRTHTVLGEQMLGGVAFLQGEGIKVVRSHHEHWDGGGYPDGLARDDIAMCARIFAVADALDAMTSDRPYRKARGWDEAKQELEAERGRQFDPDVVDAFREREHALRGIQREFGLAERPILGSGWRDAVTNRSG
jgi:response regulator RpfG family c-di-GMP phosphodiesterase